MRQTDVSRLNLNARIAVRVRHTRWITNLVSSSSPIQTRLSPERAPYALSAIKAKYFNVEVYKRERKTRTFVPHEKKKLIN